MGLLEGFRALDLMNEKGYYCGKILAEHGVEVIKVEKPGGDEGRNIGPYYRDEPDAERSLNWFALNTDKKGITLNIEDRKGQELFKKLVGKVDFVLESFEPGYMDRIGLGYEVLKEVNPRLVYTTLTSYGQKGPYRDYLATDIVAMAMGGAMSLTGQQERPPVRFFGDQAYYFACSFTALGTLMAHHYRQLTGEGQRVDVALVDCVVRFLWRGLVQWDLRNTLFLRGGISIQKDGKVTQGEAPPSIWPCKDGYVTWNLGQGPTGAPRNRDFVQWLEEDGMDVGELREVEWEKYYASQLTPERREEWFRLFSSFFTRHTKEELATEAARRKVILMPLCDMPDVMNNEQLKARGFWSELEHEDWGIKLRYPGHLFFASETENRVKRRAPHIGEHNELILGQELGLSAQEMASLKEARVV